MKEMRMLRSTSDGLSRSTVTRCRPSDGSVDPACIPDAGFVLVGAGVSTCAPLETPK